MPLGPYETFGECIGAQKRKGHSDESARKICGSLEQQASSQYRKDSASYNNNMSFPPKKEDKPEGDGGGGGKIEISMEQGQALAQAAMNLPPSPEADIIQKIVTDVMDIEQEQTDPPGPPMK